MLSQRCAHAQVLLRHKHHLVTMRKRSWFLYKVLVLSPPTGWNISSHIKQILELGNWFCPPSPRPLDVQRATETDKSEHKRVFQKHINANFFILAPNVFLKEHLCPKINMWLLKPTAPNHSSSGLYVFMSWWWICNDPSLLITNRKQPHVAEGVSHVIMFELAASLLAFSVTFELIWTAE